jgi:hypothetical protein
MIKQNSLQNCAKLQVAKEKLMVIVLFARWNCGIFLFFHKSHNFKNSYKNVLIKCQFVELEMWDSRAYTY